VVRPVLKSLRDEAAGTAGPQLAGNITPPETDNGRGQRDNAGDKKKMSPRGLSSEARACAKLYKTKRKADTKITMRAVILEYIEEHGGSFSSIKKSLSAHPDEWKTHNKRDN
jgi:hypothetical protein